MPNDLTPEAFKQRIVTKYPDGVASDGRRYSDMEASELTQKIVDKFPDGVTADGHRYADFLGTSNVSQETTSPSDTRQGLGQVAIGSAKSLASLPVDAASMAEGLVNQTAGRLVSAARGDGFNPLPKEELKYSEQSPLGSKIHGAVKPTNFSQKLGYYGTEAAQLLAPVGVYKAVTKAPEALKAAEIVAPKLTPSKVKEAYKSGRATVSGLLRRVGVQPDTKTLKAGEAAQGLVKGKTVAEDANSVRAGIKAEAEALKKNLAAREIQPTVQPEELDSLYKTALDEIAQNPFLDETGAKKAGQIFTKFKSYLPTDRPINANDILDARQKTDAWAETQRGSKVFGPDVESAISIALRTIRQGANKLLISKADDVAVQESLAKQSSLFDALDGLATKAPAELGTTAPGRFLNRHPVVKGLVQNILPGGLVGGYIGAKFFGD